MNINISRLRGKINEFNFTISSFAAAAGISESTLYRVLNSGVVPKTETLELIAAPLGVSAEWLMSDSESAGNDSEMTEPVKNENGDEDLQEFFMIQMRMMNEHLEYSRKQFRVACVVIIALVAFICAIFMIDILNPAAGWLRY